MNAEPVRAMILAAGAGSRLDPLTQLLPKPLVPIANRAVMEHVLLLLNKHGISDVAANLYHLADKIPAHFDGLLPDTNIEYVTESELSGDAGGLRACKSFFTNGTFVVLMGDIVTDVDLTFLIEQHKRSGAIASIGLQEVENVEQFGIVELDQEGFIQGFKEKPKVSETSSRLASIGIYVFEPEIFDHIPEDGIFMFGKQLFPHLLEVGLPILGVRLPDYWSDIGTIDSYKRTTFDGLDGKIDFSGSKIEKIGNATVLVGKNVTIDENVEFYGHVVIGDNCVIGPKVTISDSIIWNDCKIGAGAEIDDTVLATGTVVDAGAMFKGEAILQSDAAQFAAISIMSDCNKHNSHDDHHRRHRPAASSALINS